jgi:hypothetical protein
LINENLSIEWILRLKKKWKKFTIETKRVVDEILGISTIQIKIIELKFNWLSIELISASHEKYLGILRN